MGTEKKYENGYDITELMEMDEKNWPLWGDLIPILREYRYKNYYLILSDDVFEQLVADANNWNEYEVTIGGLMDEMPENVNDIYYENFYVFWEIINRNRLLALKSIMERLDHLVIQGDIEIFEMKER